MRLGLGVVAQKGLAGMGGGQSFWGFISFPSPQPAGSKTPAGTPRGGC